MIIRTPVVTESAPGEEPKSSIALDCDSFRIVYEGSASGAEENPFVEVPDGTDAGGCEIVPEDDPIIISEQKMWVEYPNAEPNWIKNERENG